MLYRTFVHLPGITEKKERELWQAGIEDWWDFLACENIKGFSPSYLLKLKERLRQCVAFHDDLEYMAACLPKDHHWRLYEPFKNRILYLDIETDGLVWNKAKVTVIGLSDGCYYKGFVYGKDLEEALPIIASAQILVTFGGTNFDLPFLKAKFPWLPLPPVHLDLCPLLKKIGLQGGLKAIEKQLGIGRSSELEGVNGYEAVKLWRKYCRGNKEALKKLILYNKEDVINLKWLIEVAYKGISQMVLNGNKDQGKVFNLLEKDWKVCKSEGRFL